MIDPLKNSQDNLFLAVERFELLAKATHDVIWDWDLVNNNLWWSNGFEQLFGYKPGQLTDSPDSWKENIHPDDRERVIATIYTAIDQGETNWSDFYRFRRADGTYAAVHDRGYTIQIDGKTVRMVGSMADLTEQIESERARKESEEKLKFALQAAQLGIWNMDPVHKIVSFDERCRELYGRPSDELTYDNLIQYIHFEDRDRIAQAVAKALDPDLRQIYDVRYRAVGASDKTLRWLHCNGKAYFTPEGTPYRFTGIMRDVTNDISSQEKVLWADQQAAMTIEGSGAGSFLVKLHTDEVIYSPTMGRIITGSDDTNLSRNLFIEHIHPEDLVIRQQAYARAEKSGDLRYEARFVWKDGSIHWIRAIGQYLYDSSGKAISLSGIVMDITDRIESEQKLKASEERYRQLAAELEQRVQQRTAELHQANVELTNSNNNLQQFAYAASHDMQEPLRKIQSFGSRLQSVYAKALDDNGVFMLNRIQDASRRMSLMIDDLLAYSRLTTREAEFKTVDLGEIVSNVIADLEISIQEQKASITTCKLPVVCGNPHQLTQLIQNLLSNAIKYKHPEVSPKIIISCEAVTEADLQLIPNRLAGHSYICLAIADNGIGFEEIYLDRIFQMFQRLHGRSEFAGSGIGLALCKKVVQNHHGYITAKSEPNKGSTFIVYLPEPQQK
jgi:PAS domain S-box-containing protein